MRIRRGRYVSRSEVGVIIVKPWQHWDITRAAYLAINSVIPETDNRLKANQPTIRYYKTNIRTLGFDIIPEKDKFGRFSAKRIVFKTEKDFMLFTLKWIR